MVTLNEMVYDVLETLRAHLVDDDDIDPRQIEAFVKDYRAQFLKQKIGRAVFGKDQSMVQYIPNLATEKVNASSIPGVDHTNTLIRTVSDIPTTIPRMEYANSMLSISSPNKLAQSFTICSHDEAISSGYGRFNKDEIFAFPYDKQWYLYSRGENFKLIYTINMYGIFNDPQEVYELMGETFTGDEDFYTPRDIKGLIVNTILRDKYKIIVNQPVDKEDNGQADLERQ